MVAAATLAAVLSSGQATSTAVVDAGAVGQGVQQLGGLAELVAYVLCSRTPIQRSRLTVISR
jgi:hypothetical protein